jgi:hypothetical protein
MGTMGLTQADRDAIESMMDRAGVSEFLTVVQEVCNEKAEHVLTNWQDKGLARDWRLLADKVSRAAEFAGGM